MNWDSRLNDLGVHYVEPPNARWKCTAVEYQDETQSGGRHHIFFSVVDATGKPLAGIPCHMDWDGRTGAEPQPTMATDAGGKANIAMYAKIDPGLKNGPYYAFIDNREVSGSVRGWDSPTSCRSVSW